MPSREKAVDRGSEKGPGVDNSSSETKGQDLSFSAQVSLDRSQMQIDDRLINLTPGMAAMVEIRTGYRSLLGYLSVAADEVRTRELARKIVRTVTVARSGRPRIFFWQRRRNSSTPPD